MGILTADALLAGGLDPLMVAFNESLPFDRVLYAHDIAGSVAWARANQRCGILTADEFAAIERGFEAVAREWEGGTFEVRPDDEDVHTANERRLGELIGKEIAGKLHTGRSRNDQIATDMRLWLRDRLRDVDGLLVDFLRTACARARREIDVLMPGYTHLQRAQPIRWSHWVMMHATNLAQDLSRLREVIRRVNRCPLGSGALAGNSFGVDRAALARELGFDGLVWNSMAAVSERDFVLEALQWGSLLMAHLSRWAEDLIVYSAAEFGFVRLADAFSTGSSLMPQKKNPDSLELVRGKAGRLFGLAAGLTLAVKGLPSAYNKDLQESVPAMLDGVRTVADCLRVAAAVLASLAIDPARMRAALTPDMLATELADYLVRRGEPFRSAHEIAGRVVALAEREGRPMDRLTAAQLAAVHPGFGDDVRECFDFERAVDLKASQGGTARASVLEQIEVLERDL
jgi:argininosuccinate lyase